MRFRRVHSHPQTVTHTNKVNIPSNKVEHIPVQQDETLLSKKSIDAVPVSTESPSEKADVQLNSDPISVDSIHAAESNSDEEKVNQALLTEKNANRALGFLIGSLIGFFALILPGIVLFIFGAIYYHRAKNSQYITEKGSRRLDGARTFYIIDFVLTSALLIGTIGILINSLL